MHVQDAVDACYRLVSAVHSMWKPIKREFDDYIANPKASGYSALHTGECCVSAVEGLMRRMSAERLLLLPFPSNCSTFQHLPCVHACMQDAPSACIHVPCRH